MIFSQQGTGAIDGQFWVMVKFSDRKNLVINYQTGQIHPRNSEVNSWSSVGAVFFLVGGRRWGAIFFLSRADDASRARFSRAGPHLHGVLLERHLAWPSQPAVGQSARHSEASSPPAAPTAGQCTRLQWQGWLAGGASWRRCRESAASAVPQDPRGSSNNGGGRESWL
jgi:hypothetical protein